ncbi:MAG: hypothetical protein SVQ76_02270 [Candidatus Nanohaloarchaea archaeon]|nr:hypothetical protein [Candidatus Nanohaloarchaea archaeon]
MEQDGRVERWLEDDFEERWLSLLEDETEENGSGEVLEEENESKEGARELAVVERDLPDGLFGFTRRGSDHVVVSSNLYEVDRRRTVQHEKTHHRHPKDELTIRYINGDLDVENTLSFQANNASRFGERRFGVPDGAAAYSRSPETSYSESYDGEYI